MAATGAACLIVALLTAAYSAVAALYGATTGRRQFVVSARRAIYALAGVLVLAMVLLEIAFARSDFSFSLVQRYSSTDTPLFYKLTAMWSSQEGSLLLWATLLSVYSSVVLYVTRHRHRDIAPSASAVPAVIAVFSLGLIVIGDENAFATVAHPAAQGQGLNPLLRHPAMMFHPPALYSGYVGFAIPFAFMVGALVTRRTNADWIRSTRRFALIAWTFLGTGVLLGALWSYTELGWVGYWAWDPVENAALMPWLTSTAFLHSVMVQEKRGMLKLWNVSLIAGTFVLSLLGTFLVRSGVLSSIHAFGASTLGTPFLIFIGLCAVGSVVLIVSRVGDLRTEAKLDSLMSREAFFLRNNLGLGALCVGIAWGTYFPLISEAITGPKETGGPPVFKPIPRPMTPYTVVHIVFAALSRGVAVSGADAREGEVRWTPGPWAAVGGYRMTYVKPTGAVLDDKAGTGAPVTLGALVDVRKGDQHFTFRPGRNYYPSQDSGDGVVGRYFNGQSNSEVSVKWGPLGNFWTAAQPDISVLQAPIAYANRHFAKVSSDELALIIAGLAQRYRTHAPPITFTAIHSPMIMWIWLGGLIVIMGSLTALWPSPEARRRRASSLAAARLGRELSRA